MPKIPIKDLHPIAAGKLDVPLDQIKREFDSAIDKVTKRRGNLPYPNQPISDHESVAIMNEIFVIVSDKIGVPLDQLKDVYAGSALRQANRPTGEPFP